jgi:ribonuclease-3
VTGPNPAAALNELTQAGLLQANGYELLDQSGPSHQPTFTTIAWATMSDGRTIRSEPISGSSKKSGQRAAAGRLLDLLVQEGITGC